MEHGLDIAWLAGVFDGEGCVQVMKAKRKHGVVFYTVAFSIANTSPRLLNRCMSVLASIGVKASIYDVDDKPETNRQAYVLRVSRKHDVKKVLLALHDQITGKRDEVDVALWFLGRQCAEPHHTTTAAEKRILDTLSATKKNAGVIPDDVVEEMRDVGVPLTKH
jgi:hypothetical protein